MNDIDHEELEITTKFKKQQPEKDNHFTLLNFFYKKGTFKNRDEKIKQKFELHLVFLQVSSKGM